MVMIMYLCVAYEVQLFMMQISRYLENNLLLLLLAYNVVAVQKCAMKDESH